MRTRAELEEALAEGGSVLWQGRIITKADDLPSDLEMAQGDPARESAVLAAAQAELQAAKARAVELEQLLAASQLSVPDIGKQSGPDTGKESSPHFGQVDVTPVQLPSTPVVANAPKPADAPNPEPEREKKGK